MKISRRANKWVDGLFRERMLSLRVGKYKMALADMLEDVSQGSVLRPTLVPIINNDWANSMRKTCYLFVDDVEAAGVDLEEDTEAAKAWSHEWELPLNLENCQRFVVTSIFRR